MDCGQSYHYSVMDFDHVRGEKIGNVNKLMTRRCIAKLEEEIAKCDLVCSNCHRLRTWEREQARLEKLVNSADLNPAANGL